MREVREELRIVEDQLSALVDEADELSLRALVSETPGAEYESREAQKHASAMKRHRDDLLREMSDLERRMNDLLDRMEPAS